MAKKKTATSFRERIRRRTRCEECGRIGWAVDPDAETPTCTNRACKCFGQPVRVYPDWAILWYEAGKPKTKTIGGDLRRAQLALSKIEVAQEEGRANIERPPSTPWAEGRKVFFAHLDYLQKMGKMSPRTVEFYKERIGEDDKHGLSRHFSRYTLDQITATIIRKYLSDRADQITLTSCNRERACLSRLLNHCEAEGLVRGNPFATLERKLIPVADEPRRRVYLAAPQMKRLLAHVRAEAFPKDQKRWTRRPAKAALRLLIILTVAIYTGLRRSDILELKWAEVDLDGGAICKKKIAKKRRLFDLGETSDKPIVPDLAELFQEYLRRFPPVGPWVFPSPKDGRKPMIRSARFGWERVRQHLNLPDVRLHDLRRTFAMYSLDNGVPLEEVQELMDHESIETTRRIYTIVTKEKLRARVDRLAMIGQ
jgi:integrase